MKANLTPFARRTAHRAPFTAFTRIERLESRIAPAYAATLVGAAATLTGDLGSDTLIITAVGGLLSHNRFDTGDFGFASATDFDTATPGVQTLAAAAGSSVAIILGAGTDTVVLGGDQRATQLQASFSVTNTGADGDVLEVNDAAGTAAVNLVIDATTISGFGFTLTRAGESFGTLRIRTGAGNDTVLGTTAGVALDIDGGPGSDTLTGGTFGDVIRGGVGNDAIVGRQGSDLLFGDEGLDTFVWNPGDGSDTIDGGAGTDLLTFNGSNATEAITFSALNGHFRLFRNIANITMDSVAVEQLELNAFGGADALTSGDLATTSLRAVRIDLALDGALDSLTLNGSDLDDHLRVDSIATGVKISGFGPSIELSGFDATDQLTVNGGLGVDNVFGSSAALAKLVVTLSGETASNAPGGVAFATPATYDAGKSPASVVSGNLFGKGAVVSNDLVVADAKTNSILILTNAGNGTFLSATQLSTGGKAPRGVVLADFNGDSHLDIAVTNRGSGNVAIFLNAGDGTFAAPALFPTTKTPGALRTADVTGDTKLDLVMVSAGNTVSILPGNGDGTFGPAVKLATGGTAPTDLVLADFSGDGRLDIAVANGGSGTVALLRANPGFTFDAPVATRVGVKPTALAIADFDGDGRPDLAVTHGVSRFVSVLFNAAPATTAFSSQLKLARPGNNAPTAIAAGDLDGDGRADLVIGNTAAGTVSVLRNLGSGLFAPALTFDLDNIPPRKISAVVLADFNGDGRLDLATANTGTADVGVLTTI